MFPGLFPLIQSFLYRGLLDHPSQIAPQSLLHFSPYHSSLYNCFNIITYVFAFLIDSLHCKMVSSMEQGVCHVYSCTKFLEEISWYSVSTEPIFIKVHTEELIPGISSNRLTLFQLKQILTVLFKCRSELLIIRWGH